MAPTQKRGKKKNSKEAFDFPSVRGEDGTPVRHSRLIDREEDKYMEHVETEGGEVIHHCEEPLSEHYGHGSAKRKEAGEEDASGPKDR